ncbi:MAG: DJ-1/PfpI family protein [Lachnospiraceae bacterium]|nr:DJ-1/PfpI family protein [Lachnospiraceae bacterium]
MSVSASEHKVALFLANGCETIEALTVADILYRAGIPCTKVSVNSTPVVVTSHNVTVVANTTVDHLDWDSFDMLVLPGGIPGTPNLKDCAPLMEQVARFHRKGKMIAAICAAPSIFAQLGLLKGVRATCNPSVESILLDGGADLVRENAVTTGNIITSRAMGTAIPFALAIVEHYLGKEKADDLGRNILYYQ